MITTHKRQVARSGPVVPPHNLCEAFQQTAARFADELALRTPDGATELTWDQYRREVERAARELAALCIARGDTVGLMLTNRPAFHILDLAAVHLGATPFSIYNTSSAEQIEHVLRNADCRVLVCEPQFLEQVSAARRRAPALEHLVVLDSGELTLRQVGAEADSALDFERRWRSVRPTDIATIIYTSGTTGPPKGVMITHANLLAAWDCSIAAAPVLARRGRYLSYLPTAHLADRVFSHYPALRNGSSITCVEDPRAAVLHLPLIRPTVWLAVPRVWEKLKHAIEAGAFGPPDDRLRARLGLEEAELLVSGAAPIRADVLEFFAELEIEICEGYGMSESTAIATLNRPGATRAGTVGPPMHGVEVELAPDGEVLIRGPVVMAGYRREPDKTGEAIDSDSWLHTGDIGSFEPDGYLRIIDRKKELIINAAGKNMSPQNIEAQLKAASPLIAHAAAIGDRRPYNTALIVLDSDMLAPRALAPDDPRIEDVIGAAVERANARLSRVEQIKRFAIVEGPWEPGGDLLTPTLKLKRKAIAERYTDTIEDLYA